MWVAGCSRRFREVLRAALRSCKCKRPYEITTVIIAILYKAQIGQPITASMNCLYFRDLRASLEFDSLDTLMAVLVIFIMVFNILALPLDRSVLL